VRQQVSLFVILIGAGGRNPEFIILRPSACRCT